MKSRLVLLALFLAVSVFYAACRTLAPADPEVARMAQARTLAQQYLIVDGHIDVPYRLSDYDEDISRRTPLGDFDFPRAKEGGLNAPFMSIYIPAGYQETGGAKALADSLIDMVESWANRWPDNYAVATSVADVRRHFAEGKVSLPMGMENGEPIEGDLANLRYFYDRGIRYITLTHGRDNHLSDSSYDTTGTWGGLSPFGEEVVREMNRLGIMVDISHLSDEAAEDVLRISQAPVIASHSSAQVFTPGWERNMNDDLIRKLAENGGVMMINFGSAFLRTEYQTSDVHQRAVQHLRERGMDPNSHEGRVYIEQQRKANPVGSVADVVDHIDHVVHLVGVEHVGLGSDYDGVFALPAGLLDVSTYPNLIAELLERGYSEQDIRLILGENLLRVWSEVERIGEAGSR